MLIHLLVVYASFMLQQQSWVVKRHRIHGSHCLKYFLSGSLQKMFADHCSRTFISINDHGSQQCSYKPTAKFDFRRVANDYIDTKTQFKNSVLRYFTLKEVEAYLSVI